MDIKDRERANADRVIKTLLRMTTPWRNYWVLLPPMALMFVGIYLLIILMSGVSHDIDSLGDAVSRSNRAESACVDAGGDPVMADFGLKYIGCRRPK